MIFENYSRDSIETPRVNMMFAKTKSVGKISDMAAKTVKFIFVEL